MNDIQQLKLYKILLIGDNCLDVYRYGNVDRISPEAPVPVFTAVTETTSPGMAGNVAINLEKLGCDINFLHGETSVKTRLVDIRSKQQIVRIDNDIPSVPITFDTVIPDTYDAVVISDYNKGTVSYELIEEIIHSVTCPVFIDTKKTELGRFQGAWVKINELEYSKIKTSCDTLIVTSGADGAKIPSTGLIVPTPKVEVVDVTGAGDTFLSALTYMFLESNDIKEAMQFANRAASLTVQHVGCYAPTLDELL